MSTNLQFKNQSQPAQPTILSVSHYNNKLFSFRVTRPAGLRFRSGEFIMLGLPGENGKAILRAYSIASPSWDDELEFYSIKVPDGPLTLKLQAIKPNDQIIIGSKPVGSLVLDALSPGKRLYLLATGTGFAPFASLIRDPLTYEMFDQVIVTHTCRKVNELAYSKQVVSGIQNNDMVADFVGNKLIYYPTTTREDSQYNGRISNQIMTGEFSKNLALPDLNPQSDRVMVCGSMDLNTDLKKILENRGFSEGANSSLGEYVLEKSFVGEGI